MKFILFILVGLFLLLPSPSWAYEGAGLFYKDTHGALPKAMFRGAKRSQIVDLIRGLPARHQLPALQQLQKNLLLSIYDLSVIDNDVPPSPENNLLTLRLKKLLEMGEIASSYDLYVRNIDAREGNVPLAQLGLILTLLEKGMGTACLEYNIMGTQAMEGSFGRDLSYICAKELGKHDADIKPDSTIIQALYETDDFRLSYDQQLMAGWSLLEIILAFDKDAILFDEKLDAAHINPFHYELIQRAVVCSRFAVIKECDLKSLKGIKCPFGVVSGDCDPLAKKPLQYKVVFAEGTPYFMVVNQLVSYVMAPDENKEGIYKKLVEILPEVEDTHRKNLTLLMKTLDNRSEFSNNPASIYEKRLLGQQKYWYQWLKTNDVSDQYGLYLLAILYNATIYTGEYGYDGDNSVENKVENYVNLIFSLYNLGVIKVVRHVIQDILIELTQPE